MSDFTTDNMEYPLPEDIGLTPSGSHEPYAKVDGEAWYDLPEDLYIPPDALEVILEAFEGPLDLLLYLIKRQNLDILNIPVARITQQYIQYVELMRVMRFELAAEYLLMAAMLAEIKSRMLLPRPANSDTEEGNDPRADLVRRLQEYERFKKAAEDFDQLPRKQRDIFPVQTELPDLKVERPLPNVSLRELLFAMQDVLKRTELNAKHEIQQEALSIRQRMSDVLTQLSAESFTSFSSLFSFQEGRLGVIVTFIAVLELLRQSLIEMVQAEPYGALHLRSLSLSDG